MRCGLAPGEPHLISPTDDRVYEIVLESRNIAHIPSVPDEIGRWQSTKTKKRAQPYDNELRGRVIRASATTGDDAERRRRWVDDRHHPHQGGDVDH